MPCSPRGLSRRSFLKLLAAAGASAALPPLPRAWSAEPTGQVLLVSDIHFNPYSRTSLVPRLMEAEAGQWDAIFASSPDKRLASYGFETDYNLLKYGLQAMSRACAQPDCIIYTGDLPCHGVWQRFARFSQSQAERNSFLAKLVEFMGRCFRTHFPRTPVYFALGNNDAYCGDYQITPQGEYLQDTATTFYSCFLGSPGSEAAFRDDFQRLGCYSLPGPAKGLRVVTINSNYFSPRWSCQCCHGHPGDPVQEQLDWLESQLGAAAQAGEAVWLVMHIPPGVNARETSFLVGGDGKLSSVRMHITTEANARLLSILRAQAGVLRAGFAGHTHMDHFKVVTSDDRQEALAMVHITPALNPLYGGNPAFQVLTYSKSTFTPLDTRTYYLNLEKQLLEPGPAGEGSPALSYQPWQLEYRFQQVYGVPALDPASLWALSQTMRTDQDLRERFRLFYNGSRGNAPSFGRSQAKAYWCALAHLEPGEYLQAYNSQELTSLWPGRGRRAA